MYTGQLVKERIHFEDRASGPYPSGDLGYLGLLNVPSEIGEVLKAGPGLPLVGHHPSIPWTMPSVASPGASPASPWPAPTVHGTAPTAYCHRSEEMVTAAASLRASSWVPPRCVPDPLVRRRPGPGHRSSRVHSLRRLGPCPRLGMRPRGPAERRPRTNAEPPAGRLAEPND